MSIEGFGSVLRIWSCLHTYSWCMTLLFILLKQGSASGGQEATELFNCCCR